VTLAEAVTRRVVRRLGAGVLAAPAIAYGASGEHEDFPGTVSVGHAALRLVLVELARSACRWTGGVVFVNGHGGIHRDRGGGRAAAACGGPGRRVDVVRHSLR
jgi:creatinine amidohydrolase/Fe(II)-dependent formamide hydrolase-like protein